MARLVWMRRVAAMAASAVLFSSLSTSPVFAQGGDAKAQLAEGDKAARAKEWQKARDAYDAANKAQPSADALEGVANASYQMKQDAEAYAAYSEWNKLYGDKAPKPKKAAVEARLKEIATRTGELTINVNEQGAAIQI